MWPKYGSSPSPLHIFLIYLGYDLSVSPSAEIAKFSVVVVKNYENQKVSNSKFSRYHDEVMFRTCGGSNRYSHYYMRAEFYCL